MRNAGIEFSCDLSYSDDVFSLSFTTSFGGIGVNEYDTSFTERQFTGFRNMINDAYMKFVYKKCDEEKKNDI